MNSVKAKGIAKIAMDSLQSNSKLSIHSVFENSMNLLSGEQLIYVGERALPFGLLIESFNDIKGAQNVYLEAENLIFNQDNKKTIIRINNLELIDVMHQGKLSCLDEKLEILKKSIQLSDEKPLEYYIGRGQGLTPSGDDFLVGMYCVSFCKRSRKDMMTSLSHTQFEGLTTTVSVAYLNAARNGYFNPDLINLLSCESKAEFENLFEIILNTGHSSGMDTLEGILFGLELIKKEGANENENCCSTGW